MEREWKMTNGGEKKQNFVDRYAAKWQSSEEKEIGERDISKSKQTLQKTMKWRDRSTERQDMTEAPRGRDALTVFSKCEFLEGLYFWIEGPDQFVLCSYPNYLKCDNFVCQEGENS